MRRIRLAGRISAVGAVVVAAGAASAGTVTVTGYDIQNAARSGFGGWAHTYNGTITDTGSGNANGIGFTRADYTGAGDGTLNDGLEGTGPGDTQLFANNSFASPVITVYLDGFYTIDNITLFTFQGGNFIPGSVAGYDVTIGGVTESFLSSEPTDNDEFVNILGSTLDGISDNKVILSNFLHDGSHNLHEIFAIGEIGINGQVPAPGALALLGIAGLAARRRRRD
jgi:MYXO-CTERM domain-containing protein